MRRTTFTSLGLIAILAAACTSAGSSASPSASAVAATASAAAVSTAPSVAPSSSADACAKDALTLVTPGKFPIGTDNPASPPYFAENADKPVTAPWEIGDQTN